MPAKPLDKTSGQNLWTKPRDKTSGQNDRSDYIRIMASDDISVGARKEMAAILKPAPSTAQKNNPRAGSFLLSWTARLAGVAVLIGSAYMFYRFAENDLGVKVLLSAFALCFGAGALAYGPLFIIARLIKRGRQTPSKAQAFWVLALALPWLAAGLILLTYPNAMRYAGIVAAALSAIFSLWAIKHLAYIRGLLKTRTKMNET